MKDKDESDDTKVASSGHNSASNTESITTSDYSLTTAAPHTEAAVTEATTVEEYTEEKTTAAPTTESTTEAVIDNSDSGKVLNIYCWNEDFKNRMTQYYPGYIELDATHGKIGNVDVSWTIVPTEANTYRDQLDKNLKNYNNLDADSRVDIYLLESDYANIYTDSPYSMSISELGISNSEISDQYKYTQEIMKDSSGNIKALSWQVCPGVLIYNREIAKDVFGTDDPSEVQAHVKDWDTYLDTALYMKSYGYKMTASTVETYKAFEQNRKSPWVVNGKIIVDDSLVNWVNQSKILYDSGLTTTEGLWSTEWYNGFYNNRGENAFCYFGPDWLIYYCMEYYESESIAAKGGWAVCPGPASFYWGGTWIVCASGTDNKSLVADIMREMTTGSSITTNLQRDTREMANSRSASGNNAYDDAFGTDMLGGQNPIGFYDSSANSINPPTPTKYDEYCYNAFLDHMINYINGNFTYDEALYEFYTDVTNKYPELSW